MAAWNDKPARFGRRQTWAEPLALLAVVIAALTIVALVAGGGR